MRAVFIGPPGSGKGTQAALLHQRLGPIYIGTGDILREAVALGTDVGRQAKPYMDQGQLAPDAIVDAVVAERLRRPDRPANFILDGYPRNTAQARALDALLAELRLPLQAVVVFQLDDAVAVKRMLGRQRAADAEQMARHRVRELRDVALDP